MTGGAALALVVSLLLPWYQVSYFQGGEAVTDSRSALQVFTWIEAAILLVALAVLFLVYARAQRQAFHLPGGDGVVVSARGRLGARADRVAAVRQAGRRRAGRDGRHPVGDLLRAARRRRAGGGRRAGARGRAARAAQPDRRGEPSGRCRRRARRERAADARPREHTEVTQVLRERPPRGTASRPEAPGRAKRPPTRTRPNRRLRPTGCSEQLGGTSRVAGSNAFVPSDAGLIGWRCRTGPARARAARPPLRAPRPGEPGRPRWHGHRTLLRAGLRPAAVRRLHRRGRQGPPRLPDRADRRLARARRDLLPGSRARCRATSSTSPASPRSRSASPARCSSTASTPRASSTSRWRPPRARWSPPTTAA